MSVTRLKKISQSDIARLADVSISSVSRALGKGDGISAEVRDRVRRIAGELGYQGIVGERLASDALKAVVYLPMHPVTGGLHQIFQEIFDGVKAEAAEHDITLFPRLIPEEDVDLAQVTALAKETDTPAALMFYMDPTPEVARFFSAPGHSLVIVNNIDSGMRFDSIVPNNYEGSKLATRAALAAGHRSLLYITGHMRYSPRERIRGFRDAIAEVPDAAGEVISIIYDRQETAYSYFLRYFAEKGVQHSAMICAHDLVALGVIQAARENGFSVPEHLSIIGFENISWSSLTTPRLSTVNVDRAEMGREAIRLLMRRVQQPSATVLQCMQGVHYIAGGTVLDKVADGTSPA